MWITLNIKVSLILRVGQKWKGLAADNCKTTLNIEFEQDWSVGLGVTLGDGYKIKIFFYLQVFFLEKPIVPYSWGSNVQ